MIFVPVLAAPTLMLVATAAERRAGPATAGAVGAAPFALALVVLSVGGRDAGATVASAAAAHVVAQVAFAAAFARVVAVRGGARGLAAGALAFTTVSALVTLVPPALATAAAIPALLAAPPLLAAAQRRRREIAPGERPTPRDGAAPGDGSAACGGAAAGGEAAARGGAAPGRVATAAGAAAAAALVAAALTAAELAGPAAGGAVGSFPAVSAAFGVLLARTRGNASAAAALAGVARGLRGYLAFCLAVVSAAPLVGLPVAVGLGLVACALQSLTPSLPRHLWPRTFVSLIRIGTG